MEYNLNSVLSEDEEIYHSVWPQADLSSSLNSSSLQSCENKYSSIWFCVIFQVQQQSTLCYYYPYPWNLLYTLFEEMG